MSSVALAECDPFEKGSHPLEMLQTGVAYDVLAIIGVAGREEKRRGQWHASVDHGCME